ncbi:MAG: hypothetical protein IPO88_06360 [Nannocystis sp.]|uniref:hypothetical protein n=1 Tax=Nannocystis sp. TaxID=1962667 RepID=UPI002422A0F4|nr:hypothetical protein [Nannocystis sp.]MBK9753119.1 hypothetical protein [Nannocystis sp.]
MLKQLTLAVLAAGLLPACIITDGTTTSNTESSTGSATEPGTTSTASGTTTDSGNPTDSGATDSVSGTTTDVPTTDSPTTESPSSSATTDNTTTATTDNTTGGASEYGKCGWYATDKYYACEPDGGAPGVEDPEGISPIACPDGLVAGEKCDEETGPVKGVGCCTPEGKLYYCDSLNAMTIIVEECGV